MARSNKKLEDFNVEQMEAMVLDTLKEKILVLSLDLRVRYANKVFLKATKLKKKEVIGEFCYKVNHNLKTSGNSKKHKCSVAEAKKGKIQTYQLIQYNDKEEKRYVNVTIYPLKEKGKIMGYVHVSKDVTEYKKKEIDLLEQKDRYQRVTEEMNDLMSVLDKKSNYIFANKAHERILGWDVENDLSGKSVFKIIHPEDSKKAKAALAKAIKEGKGKAEIRLKSKDGSYKYFESQGKTLKEKDRYLIISRDITEKKKVEQKLVKIKEKLEEKLEEVEKINKVMVGRELKMVELKTKIAKLEDKNNNK